MDRAVQQVELRKGLVFHGNERGVEDGTRIGGGQLGVSDLW